MKILCRKTQIGLSVTTRQKLRQIGSKGETYDRILNNLINTYNELRELKREYNC